MTRPRCRTSRTAPKRSSVVPTRPERDPRHDPGLELGVAEKRRHLGRVDECGRNGVDRDPVLGPFGGPLPGERIDGSLGRHIGRVAGVDAQLPANRGDVDDAPTIALLHHLADRGLGRQKCAADVELHDPVPVVAWILLGIMQHVSGAAADGIDDDVDPPQARHGLVDGPSVLLRGRWRRPRSPGPAHLTRRPGPRPDRHAPSIVPRGRWPPRHRPGPAPGPIRWRLPRRDDRNPSAEVEHLSHCSRPWSPPCMASHTLSGVSGRSLITTPVA